jgi:hypothetical protein
MYRCFHCNMKSSVYAGVPIVAPALELLVEWEQLFGLMSRRMHSEAVVPFTSFSQVSY